MKNLINTILVAPFFFISCNNDNEILNNSDLIFSNSVPIEIYAYSYTDTNNVSYFVQGDTAYYTSIPDTLNNIPEFRWDSLDFGITTVVISSSLLRAVGSEIANYKDILWQWHTGMEYGFEGRVKHSEGKYVTNGMIDYNNKPIPLSTGDYYWAVWKWDSDGTKIINSSRQMHFYVK